MKLATVSTLRSRLLGNDNEVTNAALELALLAATPHIETALRTTVNRDTRKDLFFIDFAQFPQRWDRLQFLLTKGFVDKGQTFEIKVDIEQDNLDAQDALDTNFFRITADEHGKLLIFGSDLLRPTFFRQQASFTHSSPFSVQGIGATMNQLYVQVEYTSGFESKNDPDSCGSKVYKNVPEWLEEAALQVAREIYLKNVDVIEGDVERATTMLSNTRGIAAFLTMAERMVQPHVRFWPAWQQPMFTEIV
jgi:hypothetical protein